jgi:hypothetical protein
MASWDTCMFSSSGNSPLSQPDICSGDQSCFNFWATTHRSRCRVARRQGFGRHADSHASKSASDARYRSRPPWRAISRLTVEGALSMVAAILRIEQFAAIPREISSRSPSCNTNDARRRSAGTIPPLATTTPNIEAACFPNARPMSLSDSPAFQRCQSSDFWESERPGRPIRAIHSTFFKMQH